jgi:hypothetical protein
MREELIIRHDGRCWVVESEYLKLSAPTLEELDSKVEKKMKEMGLVKEGEKLVVFMMFDNSTIPQWIRQYAQHYFNRILVVEG